MQQGSFATRYVGAGAKWQALLKEKGAPEGRGGGEFVRGPDAAEKV